MTRNIAALRFLVIQNILSSYSKGFKPTILNTEGQIFQFFHNTIASGKSGWKKLKRKDTCSHRDLLWFYLMYRFNMSWFHNQLKTNNKNCVGPLKYLRSFWIYFHSSELLINGIKIGFFCPLAHNEVRRKLFCNKRF